MSERESKLSRTGFRVASCSWPDHLTFGEADGKLASPAAVERRMAAWRDEMGARIVHWREVRTRRDLSHYYASPDNPRKQETEIKAVSWDDFRVVPEIAHSLGLKAYIYVSVLDDGRPLPDEGERNRSYHNAMHGQHVTWQTDWSREHPQFTVADRSRELRQWGVLCYVYPEVQEQMTQRILSFVDASDFDGVFLCLRSQCRPAEHADQFGFNDVIAERLQELQGEDILKNDFDLEAWRILQGKAFTAFLARLREDLLARKKRLAVGVPRGEIIGPPLGNWPLEWRLWVSENLVDELVIDQNSSQCPSMWHQLWPMHRGYGYLQNYTTGKGMVPLLEDLDENYRPVIQESRAELYIARQWFERDSELEQEILRRDFVDGMAFSTFRYDNPGVLKRRAFYA